MSSEWPEGLPRDYDELATQYGDYIAQQVTRYNKVDRNFEDLFQSIWLKIIESDVLRKFAARAAAALPPTMTAEEACAYLGVTNKAWGTLMYRSGLLKAAAYRIPIPVEGPWFSRTAVVRTVDVVRLDQSGYVRKRKYPRYEGSPAEFGATMTVEEACAFLGVDFHPFWHNLMRAAKREREANKLNIGRLTRVVSPIKGKRYSSQAVFLSSDVRYLDEIGYFRKRSPVRVRPKPSARGFKSYLSRAIHNHFANYCRTRSRRYKEHVLPPTTVMSPTSSGYCYAGRSEEGTAWEGALVEAMISAEDAVDVVSEIRKADVDPNTDRGVEILDYVAQGYTIEEAIKVQQRHRPARVRVRHHA